MEKIHIIEGLSEVREKMRAASKGIGEPAVRIDPETLLVSADDPLTIHMRMDHLIGLVASIVD